MGKIVIIGASGLGKEIKTIVDDVNEIVQTWELVGFYDDSYVNETEVCDGIFCKGTTQTLIENTKSNISVVFGIADREVASRIYDRLKEIEHFDFPNIIHPALKRYEGLVLGTGNVIASGSFLSCDIVLGDFNFFNTFTAVGHDVKIGNFNCFMPRTQISGNVLIGDYNFFGMNSSIVQNKTVGNNNIINAYTLLTKSIKNYRKYFGIPGKRIDN
jgi:sugar O-acyltransferase (sialic acid O-acetyltransferase NeuD family)